MTLVHTAEFETPIGSMLCATTGRGLAYVRLPRAGGRGFAGWLRRFAPGAEVRTGFAPNRAAVQQILEYLDGKRSAFELALDLRGTDFQRRVWEQLLAIPYGETRSYGEIARALDLPLRAARAVGTANGANPCAIVVPCHRVVAAGGKLGGYGGGLPLKRRLLALEHARPADGDLL
jgi:methylated-DNA-[protein]-cysteine S-methyltransferase